LYNCNLNLNIGLKREVKMKYHQLSGFIIILCMIPAQMFAQHSGEPGITDEGPAHHLIYPAGEIDWQDAPASLEPGGQVAILEGNPSEPGVFTMRIKMPDGYHISPHWHPNVERVTVVSGTFLLGSGDEMNRDETEALKAGSYTSMPPEMRHYAIAEGETVIQLTSVGPWIINYINPDDDPRLR
jgi:quercetin dioxygenase-like cupin family protein